MCKELARWWEGLVRWWAGLVGDVNDERADKLGVSDSQGVGGGVVLCEGASLRAVGPRARLLGGVYGGEG